MSLHSVPDLTNHNTDEVHQHFCGYLVENVYYIHVRQNLYHYFFEIQQQINRQQMFEQALHFQQLVNINKYNQNYKTMKHLHNKEYRFNKQSQNIISISQENPLQSFQYNQYQNNQQEQSSSNHDKQQQANQSDKSKASNYLPQVGQGRHDNSLSVLTSKFIQLIKQSPNKTIDLNKAVNTLNVQKRRIYDITNVLQGVGFIQKTQKNTIKWKGDDVYKNSQEQIKDIIDNIGTIISLLYQQHELDRQIQSMYQYIGEQYLHPQDIKPQHLISIDDCIQVAKKLQYQYPGQKMVLLSAPKGSILQAIEEEDGTSEITINAQKCEYKGEIKMYIIDPHSNKVHEFIQSNNIQYKIQPLRKRLSKKATEIIKEQYKKQQKIEDTHQLFTKLKIQNFQNQDLP